MRFFLTFSTFAQRNFKGWGCNFTWRFGKVMHSNSMNMVFVGRIIRHKLCMIYAFLHFSYLCLKIFRERGCSFTWSFGKVMRSKSAKMVFVTSIIRHRLCIIYAVLIFFVQKLFLNKNHFLIAEINLTTRGSLCTCLVFFEFMRWLYKKLLWL